MLHDEIWFPVTTRTIIGVCFISATTTGFATIFVTLGYETVVFLAPFGVVTILA
jgi:hypothetical protein